MSPESTESASVKVEAIDPKINLIATFIANVYWFGVDTVASGR